MNKILIIEDEEAIADLEKDYLELSDFQVDIQNTGDKGLKAALEGDYKLIILDLMMPGMDGFEVCRQIRKEKNIPILMVLSHCPPTPYCSRRTCRCMRWVSTRML